MKVHNTYTCINIRRLGRRGRMINIHGDWGVNSIRDHQKSLRTKHSERREGVSVPNWVFVKLKTERCFQQLIW